MPSRGGYSRPTCSLRDGRVEAQMKLEAEGLHAVGKDSGASSISAGRIIRC